MAEEPLTRVPASDIVKLSKDHGYLAKQFYVIFTRPTNGLGPVFERVEEHLKGQERLEREGIMVAAGPNWTDDEQYWEGEGMFVIRASSIEEARKIADDDIMHREGAREYRVRPWMINEGSLTFTLGMATGRFELK